CAIQRADDGFITVESANAPEHSWQKKVRCSIAELNASTLPDQKWARYALGALIVLQQEYSGFSFNGVRLFIASDIPPGSGLAASAALGIAVLYALIAAVDLSPGDGPRDASQVARLAQRVENEIVGAPCGLM